MLILVQINPHCNKWKMERTPRHFVNVISPPKDPSKTEFCNADGWTRDARCVILSLASSSSGGGTNTGDYSDE